MKLLIRNFSKTLAIGGLISSSAFAQTQGAGNGGGAEYCPNESNPQAKFQTYDLAEYRGPWGITSVDPTLKMNVLTYDSVTTKAEYLNHAIQKIEAVDPGLAIAIRKTLETLNQSVMDKGQLALVNDGNILFNQAGCTYYQLLNWVDGDEVSRRFGLPAGKDYIFRDNIAYFSMDPLSQAANDLHEAVYKVKREFKFNHDDGSTYIRRFVAQVFSDAEINHDVVSRISAFKQENYYEIPSREEPREQGLITRTFYFPYACGEDELKSAKVAFTNTSGETLLKNRHNRLLVNTNDKFFENETFSAPVRADKSELYFDYRIAFPLGETKNPSKHVTMTVSACGKTAEFPASIDLYNVLNGYENAPDSWARIKMNPFLK